jgi:DNA-binding LacI/PurR family transcriptional regulator
MTVSKALRDEPDVSAATKTRLKLLAQQMGYVPDSSAQGLRTRTTKLFGLAISSLTNPVFSRVVLAIEERAHELGYDVLLAHTLNVPEREEACIRRFLSRRVDGLFICPVYRFASEARIYKELLARKLGHKRIAFFAGPQAAPWSQERFEGYRRALREAGQDVNDTLVFQSGRTMEDGAKAALQMINESGHATAVQAVNDIVAIGCAQTLLNQGVRIPEDISIVGFGNILLSEYFRVPLTTVRQPKFRLGIAAMDLMLQLLRGQRGESKRLSAELIARASSGIPPATGRFRQQSAPNKETL